MMPQKIDNGLRRKQAKPSVDEGQDGERRRENTENKVNPQYAAVTAKSPVPRLVKVEGLIIVETDLPVVDTNADSDNNNNSNDEIEMRSRRKVSDESSIDETKPLQISVESGSKDKTAGNMEDETKMDEISLDEDGEVKGKETSSRKREADDNKKAKGNKEVTPVVEMAVAAFGDANKKKGAEYDLNKNAPKDGDGKAGNGSDKAAARLKPFHISNGEGRTDSFEIATKDDVDAGSVYSLFMEKDFRYYFQHPYFRLFTAYFVTFCNFLIYAEDPVAHSRSECNIPVIGNDFSFVCMKYPPNAWSLLKVFLWLLGTLVGLIIGKLLFHSYLFSK